MPDPDNVAHLPDNLERLAIGILRALERRAHGRAEWIEGNIEAAIKLANASGRIAADREFGQWCEESGFGRQILPRDERQALTAMGAHPDQLRALLQTTASNSIRLIYANEWTEPVTQSCVTAPRRQSRRQPTSRTTSEPSDRAETRHQRSTRRASEARTRRDARDAEAIRLHDAGRSRAEIIQTTGIHTRHMDVVLGRERVRRDARDRVLDELAVDPQTLSQTAQGRLEAARRLMERQLNEAHATRMRQLDEEIRLRVVAEGREYLARLREREQEAERQITTYREFTNNHRPPLTMDEFNLLRKCLHQNGIAATPADFDAAFILINGKKFKLTGQR